MRPILALLLAACFIPSALSQTAPAHPAPDAKSPVGHWIADHSPADTIVLWWDIRGDSTLTLSIGGLASGKYTLSGSALTLHPDNPGQPTGVLDIQFKDGKLYSTVHVQGSPTLEFTRIGEQTSSTSPLIGSWRLTDAPHSSDPQQEEMRGHMMNMTQTFLADGTFHTRMPIQTLEGHWNPATNTYQLKDYPALRFERKDNGLLINLPPDGKEQHLYLPDNLATH